MAQASSSAQEAKDGFGCHSSIIALSQAQRVRVASALCALCRASPQLALRLLRGQDEAMQPSPSTGYDSAAGLSGHDGAHGAAGTASTETGLLAAAAAVMRDTARTGVELAARPPALPR